MELDVVRSLGKGDLVRITETTPAGTKMTLEGVVTEINAGYRKDGSTYAEVTLGDWTHDFGGDGQQFVELLNDYEMDCS